MVPFSLTIYLIIFMYCVRTVIFNKIVNPSLRFIFIVIILCVLKPQNHVFNLKWFHADAAN